MKGYKLTGYIYDVDIPKGKGGLELQAFLDKLLEIEGVTQYALGWDVVTVHVEANKSLSHIFAQIDALRSSL